MENDLEKLHPIERFNDRVKYYSKYRPDYPESFFLFLEMELALTKNMVLADIGSGTGLFSEHLLKRGYPLICVEPNEEMRNYAEQTLASYPGFSSKNARAETTGIAAGTVDCIFVAQAFHWMNPVKTKQEFLRILKPGGKIVICWILATQDSAFLKDYENLRQEFAVDYKPVKRNDEPTLAKFYEPMKMNKKIIPFKNLLNFESLKGLLLSVSFIPKPNSLGYENMLKNLGDLFERHNINGYVEMNYELTVYWNS